MPNDAIPAETRGAVRLAFKFDADLPINARRQDIEEALRRHQVLIVAGETGSGKSTQLPQFCLQLGRGVEGMIAHTQPRRLAARALAARIADELSQPLGGAVGFRVRFADQASAATRLLLMTDGLLLAELKSDPLLRRYDTIIVDEAHERTLNIDLLLGVLKRLLPRRPDLKLIVTSATLDVERVADFFDAAPLIVVSGRNYPIEVRYAAQEDDVEDPDLSQAVCNAYRDIVVSPGAAGRGDVLVFLPGEREIRDVGDFLERELDSDVEILTLYSRLSWDQQSRIFQRGARRRVVLATNVAETSITVPGIRAVIDSGLARVSRYSPRNRLQRLPIEPVSRASAEQRKGRCGRLGPGLCIRLYSEEDFEARAAFTEPEVLRTNLAALLLRLAADGLGEAEQFPFIDPPDSRALGDGYRLLQELEAMDAERRITRSGRAMARLPLDPRLARALLESKRFHAEAELLAIVAGLSVPDARIANADGANDEAAASAAFEDNKSEFSGLVRLWRAYRKAREGPRRELRRWCKERGLSLLRLSEWDDVYTQVKERAAQMGITAQRKPASYTAVHRALLSGFCTMVGTRAEDGVYLGVRGVHFFIHPGSSLRRRRPRWVMAANIVETSRVFARRVAEIEPVWIESAARHLLKREYLEPDWDESREEVVARERVSFLGLVLTANRVVNFGPIAPEESRLIFAREALVHQRLKRRPDWLERNDEALQAARRIEERLRTRNLVHPAESFVEFYDNALPRQVSSAATLDYFTRHLSDVQRAALVLEPERIFARLPDPKLLEQFPEYVQLPAGERPASEPESAPSGNAEPHVNVAVDYRFAPGEERDGATLRVPLLALPKLTRATVDAALPGLAQPRVEALLRSLPKDARRNLIPIGASVSRFLEFMGGSSPDTARLTDWLESRGIAASLIRFDRAAVAAHLNPQFAIVETAEGGNVVGLGADLGHLRRRFAVRARAELDRRASQVYPSTWHRFEAAELPVTAMLDIGHGCIEVYPTLVPFADGAAVRYEWSRPEAIRLLRGGAARLARCVLDRQARDLGKKIASDLQLSLAASPYLRSDALKEGLLQRAFARACFDDSESPTIRTQFDAAVTAAREKLYPVLEDLIAAARSGFAAAREVRRLLDDPRARSFDTLAEETRAHLLGLMQPETIFSESIDYSRQILKYIKGEERRWQRLLARGGEAPNIGREIFGWHARVQELTAKVAAELRWLPQLDDLRAWVEEYRISLYAQELRTLGPVSATRLVERAAQIESWLTR